MKAQLVKREDRWDLYNEDGHKIASTLDGAGNKLSLKNCQAIERGYDLDELAENAFGDNDAGYVGFKLGFKKALELMGDKKFSEEDVISMIEKSRETGLTAEYLILTKQQTEWEVTYNLEELDADGCLILKRV